MKKFVAPKLTVGSEFKVYGRECVVDRIFDEGDTYHGHPFVKTKVQYHWKTSDPKSRTNWTVSLDELEQEMYEESDEFISWKIEDHLTDIEYKVNSFNEVSDTDKAELRKMISNIRKKLKDI